MAAIGATHWTQSAPSCTPRADPNLDPDLSGVIVDLGRLLQSNMMAAACRNRRRRHSSDVKLADIFGCDHVVTANKYAGMRIYVYSTTGTAIVWGNIVSHTSGTTPVFTVDQWYTETAGAVSQGTTPTTPWGYIITGG